MGTILAQVGGPRGVTWGSAGGQKGEEDGRCCSESVLIPFWTRFRPILDPCWINFGSIFAPKLDFWSQKAMDLSRQVSQTLFWLSCSYFEAIWDKFCWDLLGLVGICGDLLGFAGDLLGFAGIW